VLYYNFGARERKRHLKKDGALEQKRPIVIQASDALS
jgi:hypothetical protein